MYFDYAVAIPFEKGKNITKKKGNAVYVLYQHGQVYKPDKKYAIPQRTIIGRVNPDSPDKCQMIKETLRVLQSYKKEIEANNKTSFL